MAENEGAEIMGVDFTYTQQEVDALCKAYFEKGKADMFRLVDVKFASIFEINLVLFTRDRAYRETVEEFIKWIKEQNNE